MPAPAGSLAGTPLYLAPELFRGGAATIASDVYSLGVLLYYLLTGSYPVRESCTTCASRTSASERTSAARPDVPSKLARVIAHATDPQSDPPLSQRGASSKPIARGSTGRSGRVAAAVVAIISRCWLAAGSMLRRPQARVLHSGWAGR